MPDPKPSTAVPRLKLVIRRLPPTIPEDIFWNSISQWIDDGKSTWRKWYPGKKADDSVRQHRVFSRAYVMMADFDKLQAFASAFDGHVFRGKDGSEYQAVVEFAPSQKIPSQKSKPRVDARQGQIDKDPDFLSFVESLSAPATKPEVTSGTTEPFDNTKSTPLLEFLKEQRMGKRGAFNDSKPLHSVRTADKDVNRSRKDKEREKNEKKRVGAGGEKNGKASRGEKATTGGSSALQSAVPGQIKIAKRPTPDQPELIKDARQAKKGPTPLPDIGKRSDVKIQIKGGPDAGKIGNPNGTSVPSGQNIKGKKGREDSAGRPNNVQKQAKPDAAREKNTADVRNRPSPAEPGPPAQRRQRVPPANLVGGRNLLSAALKSSTRESVKPADGDGGRGRERAGKGGGGVVGGGGGGPAGGDAVGGAAGEKAKRPPRNRGKKGGAGDAGQGKGGGDQPGADVARIDA